MISAYLIHLLILILIWALLATSLNLALGYTGLLNLGHVAFFAIGAYASALIVKSAGVPFLIGLFAAGILAALFGIFLVRAVKGLRGDYLALATLGFSYVINSILLNWQSLTRGPLGIPGIPRPALFGATNNYAFLVIATIVVGISLYLLFRIVKSPLGRLFEAVRDNEVGAAALAKPINRAKATSMAISAFFAGIAGSLYAHYISFIDPSSFAIVELILLLTIVIAGGIASMKGSIAATIVLLLIPEALRFLNISSALVGPLRQIIYALILIGLLLYRPKGIFGEVDLQ